MRVSQFKGFRKERTPGIDDDVARELERLSKQVETLTTALQSRLSVENLNAELRTLDLLDGVLTRLELQDLSGPADGVWLLQSSLPGGVLYWEPGKTESEIKVSVTWPSSPTTRTTTRFLVLGT